MNLKGNSFVWIRIKKYGETLLKIKNDANDQVRGGAV